MYFLLCSEDIVAIGTDDDIAREFEGIEVDQKIDATGCCILPGMKYYLVTENERRMDLFRVY